VVKFTEGVGQALAISGASASESSGAIIQLSQALSNSVVQAQEFNSLLENAPRLARAAADGYAAAGGSVAQLRKLVIDGKVASDDFFRAIQSQLPKLQAEFGKTTATIGQALTVLDNALAKFVGGATNASGISGMLAGGIITLSENLNILAGVGIAVAVTAFLRFISTVNLAATAMAALNAVMVANPFGLIATAVGVAVGALVAFRDKTLEIGGLTIRVGGILNAVWTTVSESLKGVAGWVYNLSLALGKLITLDFEGAANALSEAGASLRTSGEAMITAWTAAFKPLQDALKNAGDETENVTAKTKAATKEFTDAKTKLDQQIQAYRMLGDAYREGGDAVVTAKEAIEELSQIQGINEKVTAAERAQLVELIRTLGQLKKAAAVGELQSGIQAEIGNVNRLIAARGVESAEIRAQAEYLRIKQQYGQAAADQLKEEILLLEQRRDVLASERRIRDMEDQLAMTNLEIEMIGKSVAEREKAIAVLRKEQELKRLGIDLTSEQARQEIALTEVLAGRQAELDRMRQAQQELQQMFERSFDRIGSAITEMFVQGKKDALDWKDVMRGVVSEVYQWFLQLAVLNPIKNALFGGNSPTLGSMGGLFGGGGGFGALVSDFNQWMGGGFGTGSSFGNLDYGMFFHTGGVVGNDNVPVRRVANDTFSSAPRFHTGLMPDEFPAILQKGEGVFTRAQMAALGGMGGGVTIIDQRTNAPPIEQSMDAQGGIILLIRDQINKAAPGIAEMASNLTADKVQRGGQFAGAFR
jgi:tape measure domain-containing protein